MLPFLIHLDLGDTMLRLHLSGLSPEPIFKTAKEMIPQVKRELLRQADPAVQSGGKKHHQAKQI